jgi:hypothetical protein
MTTDQRKKTVIILADLAICGFLLWSMTPDHRRKEMAMRILRGIKNTSLKTARLAGNTGMDMETAAGHNAGKPWYEAARWIMKEIYLKAEALYEKERA